MYSVRGAAGLEKILQVSDGPLINRCESLDGAGRGWFLCQPRQAKAAPLDRGRGAWSPRGGDARRGLIGLLGVHWETQCDLTNAPAARPAPQSDQGSHLVEELADQALAPEERQKQLEESAMGDARNMGRK